ncbi:Contactin-associated protein-like 2 [Galemys pyrenaicus]|uniref:Contactin-associated protein-like 2 n=1 Tax=Galemys pyrenaicus TaxID=202257 RepID=A0A8J5ZSV5_GALPY|nr:Contactin-associated protein-like 2 [Galemys pyrenaicus]
MIKGSRIFMARDVEATPGPTCQVLVAVTESVKQHQAVWRDSWASLVPEESHPEPLQATDIYGSLEDKVWTIVSHDLQMQTTVVGYHPEKYSVTQLAYSASMEQISAITSSAEYCEQYVSYFCKMSRLLNTPGTCLLTRAVYPERKHFGMWYSVTSVVESGVKGEEDVSGPPVTLSCRSWSETKFL